MSYDEVTAPADLKARLKASYDAIADTYNAWTTDHHAVRLRYLEKFTAQLPQHPAPTRLLELGCGAGVPATQLLASIPGAEVIGNDLSGRQVSLARANAETWTLPADSSVRFVEGDMADESVLSFGAGELDGVVALYSLIHLPRAEQAAMLGRIGRWLRPGGLLLANFSAGEMEGVVMEKWLAEEGWMFWSGWGEGTVGRVEEGGLEVLVQAVEKEEVDVGFLWVLARKRAEA